MSRAPEDVYAEIEQLRATPLDRTAPSYYADKADLYRRESKLWREICEYAQEDESLPMWAMIAADRAYRDCIRRAVENRHRYEKEQAQR